MANNEEELTSFEVIGDPVFNRVKLEIESSKNGHVQCRFHHLENITFLNDRMMLQKLSSLSLWEAVETIDIAQPVPESGSVAFDVDLANNENDLYQLLYLCNDSPIGKSDVFTLNSDKDENGVQSETAVDQLAQWQRTLMVKVQMSEKAYENKKAECREIIGNTKKEQEKRRQNLILYIKELQQKNNSLQKSLNVKVDQADSLKTSMDGLNDKITQLKEKNAKLNKKVNKKFNAQELLDEIESLQNATSTMELSQNAVEQECRLQIKLKTKLNADLQDLLTENDQLKQRLLELDSDAESETDDAILRQRLCRPLDIGDSGDVSDGGRTDLDDVDMSLPARAAEQAEQLVRKVLNEAAQAEQFMRKVLEGAWKVCHFNNLPEWLQDNDFIHKGHRPPLQSFRACFRSIFRIHTETGNIWTHLLGCLLFVGMAIYFLCQPSHMVNFKEKAVFATFFASAIICLGMSFTFHTVSCHSEYIGKLFNKLDYCGIAVLIIGSFVPWLYYGFYCEYHAKMFYFVLVFVLGTASIVVSMWDKFSEPEFRWMRAGVFAGFGLSGVIPALHYLIVKGFFQAVSHASFGWLCLMGGLYLLGAVFYALRVPERFFPGKCDIWFHSHQIFHVLVIAAAFVHYHGISEMAVYRLSMGTCSAQGSTPLEKGYENADV